MDERLVMVGETVIEVGLMPWREDGLTGSRPAHETIYEARIPKPNRYVEQHLRGYGRDERDAVIDLLRLRSQRNMLKIIDQGLA